MKLSKTFYYLFLFTLLTLNSCGESSGKKDEPKVDDDFSRKEMLQNWTNNIIIPSYQNFELKVTDMKQKTTSFVTNPTTQQLESLRTAWEDAFVAYQQVALFNIGKAKSIDFVKFLNIYPVATNFTKPNYNIDKNIEKGTYDLELSSQSTLQGFGAIDYMINGLATTDTEIISFYTTNAIASNYKKYLTDLSNRIETITTQVTAYWNDNFKQTFIANNGNSASSSTNILTNAFMQYFEKNIREAKIATPIGIRGTVEKDVKRVEAYYKKDISKKLFLASVKAAQDFYNGKKFNGTSLGKSYKQYLEHLDRKELAQKINNSFDEIIKAGNEANESFIVQIETDNSKMTTIFSKLQDCIKLMKTDMIASALNIQITYIDGDGD